MDNNNTQDNVEKIIHITKDDLPLSCPMSNMTKWNAHPRVFLQIENTKNHEVTCPYCSTIYKYN